MHTPPHSGTRDTPRRRRTRLGTTHEHIPQRHWPAAGHARTGEPTGRAERDERHARAAELAARQHDRLVGHRLLQTPAAAVAAVQQRSPRGAATRPAWTGRRRWCASPPPLPDRAQCTRQPCRAPPRAVAAASAYRSPGRSVSHHRRRVLVRDTEHDLDAHEGRGARPCTTEADALAERKNCASPACDLCGRSGYDAGFGISVLGAAASGRRPRKSRASTRRRSRPASRASPQQKIRRSPPSRAPREASTATSVGRRTLEGCDPSFESRPQGTRLLWRAAS